jgi:hypothetical protein
MGKPLGYYGLEVTAEAEAAFEALSRAELVALLRHSVDELADEFDCKDTDFLDRHDVPGDSVDWAKAVINRLDEVSNG